MNYEPFPSLVYYGIGVHSLGVFSYINVSWIDVRAYPPYDIMPSAVFGIVATVNYNQISNNSISSTNNSYNLTNGDFEFNSQYFFFIIDPLFIFSLLIILSLIFVIFMAIAVVKKRR